MRVGAWLVHEPWAYRGMFAPYSHASPPLTSTHESTSDALPMRRAFTSVPMSDSPASHVSSMR